MPYKNHHFQAKSRGCLKKWEFSSQIKDFVKNSEVIDDILPIIADICGGTTSLTHKEARKFLFQAFATVVG